MPNTPCGRDFGVIFVLCVTGNGDDADGWAGRVRNDNRLRRVAAGVQCRGRGPAEHTTTQHTPYAKQHSNINEQTLAVGLKLWVTMI